MGAPLCGLGETEGEGKKIVAVDKGGKEIKKLHLGLYFYQVIKGFLGAGGRNSPTNEGGSMILPGGTKFQKKCDRQIILVRKDKHSTRS